MNYATRGEICLYCGKKHFKIDNYKLCHECYLMLMDKTIFNRPLLIEQLDKVKLIKVIQHLADNFEI